MILDVADHGRADGYQAGREWFHAYWELLDELASLIGLKL